MGSVPSEVVLPTMVPRMKQPCDFFGIRVNSRKIGAFLVIALRASQSQVLRVVSPAVLLSYDVFDVEAQCRVLLKRSTILATMAGSLPRELRRGRVHQTDLPLARKARP